MKILLSYSKFHFNPESKEYNKYSTSSAAINAKTLYNVLKCFGDVEYIDFSEWEKVKGKQYDLFVGINHNFDNIRKHCLIKKSVYYAVNQYPNVRNRIISDFNRHRLFFYLFHNLRIFFKFITKKSWCNAYKSEFAPDIKSILSADYIICLGNDVVKQSYLNHKYKNNKLFMINYDLLKGPANIKTKFDKQVKILYIATEICLRKGTDIVYDMFTNLSRYHNFDYKLTIVGGGTNAQYLYLVDKLIKESKGKVEYKGSLFGDDYEKVLKDNDFYFFPSIEEGQAGTVLDAMYNGLIPIITKESGVSFSPLGFLEPKLNSCKNYEILKSVFNLTEKQKIALSRNTVDYYNKNQLGFEERLKNIFDIIIK